MLVRLSKDDGKFYLNVWIMVMIIYYYCGNVNKIFFNSVIIIVMDVLVR